MTLNSNRSTSQQTESSETTVPLDTHAFNTEQQTVVRATGGYHLVLAPPGCGKTAVLAERIAWAHSQGVDYSDMACLTFTNRAARGMRERILQRLGDSEGLDQLFIGNVHRFCSHFLFHENIVPEHTTVIDTDTSISILTDYMGEEELKVLAEAKHRQRYSQIINLQHLMHQCEHQYPGKLMVHRDALPPAALKELCIAFNLDYSQKSTIDLYRHADRYIDEPVALSTAARSLMLALYAARRYEAYKQDNDLLDFEDLLLTTYETMDDHQELKRFGWLQVDEVQDLNPLQLAIIDRFTAPGATVVYLGDAQQAIFSFMGAKTDTLSLLHERCGDDNFHNFYQNYRSPQYLLDVFNTYGRQQLNIAPSLLPTTHDTRQRQEGDTLLAEAETNAEETAMVARAVRQLYEHYPDESIAVVVAFNSDADAVSAALRGVPHFKISGTDFFSTPPIRLLLAHLGVVAMDYNFIAWAQLLLGLGVYNTNSSARQAVRAMMQLAMTPADLLLNDNTTSVGRFVKAYEEQDIVVFDTETTGLDVFSDDVVQIAAVRTRRGLVTDRLNLFIETSRPLPAMLGDVPNPLIEEYKHHQHLKAAEALAAFCRFADGCAILGHNATFDYQIMEHNMQRYAPNLSMTQRWPDYFDSLKLVHLLHPRQNSYKLRDLLVQLGLEGKNSHLADDDIMATLSLMIHCYDRGRSVAGRQLEFISRNRKMAEHFRHLYADMYTEGVRRLYDVLPEGVALCDEIDRTYHLLKEMRKVPELPKLRYLTHYIRQELVTADSGHSLGQQLSRHYTDLTTMKEADLCGTDSISERVFVSTVHKAKGLEFDNVFVYNAVEGRFPSIFADTQEAAMEEARKFYVAISRARRRLIVSFSHQSENRWGRTFTNRLTPYMDSIGHLFERYTE